MTSDCECGMTGRCLGSRAFPKTSAVIFTISTPETLEVVRHGVDEFCAECGDELKMVAWDVEEVA